MKRKKRKYFYQPESERRRGLWLEHYGIVGNDGKIVELWVYNTWQDPKTWSHMIRRSGDNWEVPDNPEWLTEQELKHRVFMAML